MDVIEPQLLSDTLIVNSVLVEDRYGHDIATCGAVTGEIIYVKASVYCSGCWTCGDCEALMKVFGGLNDNTGESIVTKGSSAELKLGFSMPSNSTTFTVEITERDALFHDNVYSKLHTINNVSQEEKDENVPDIPPIDLSKIDLTSVAIGASVGSALGLAFEGKAGAIQFGLLGGVGALAYTYLTSSV